MRPKKDGRLSCQSTKTPTRSPAFERTSKRRKGYPSETRVKRGQRTIKGGEIELLEKLGRNDPCPCGSGKSFQTLLPDLRPVSTARSGETIGGEVPRRSSPSSSRGGGAR
ncbi:SEC-C metal-binding domain-containing protein [Altererythrobacter sp. Root672]|uniref:SEC-C metal-binding domain-containing protein n=1 Tax=Altererythrobacter sp. Root672 TaxID=1736584 RepID=UPI0009EC2F1D